MNAEEQLITAFYTNFQRLDWKGMIDCYHPDIFFYDPVFGPLNGKQVAAMWTMLLSRAKDFELSFGDVQAADGYGSCHWTAVYTFSGTKRKVVNKVTANFAFNEGKIIEHQDQFSFWKWSAQALGWKGILLGGTSILQNAVRRKALSGLEKFVTT